MISSDRLSIDEKEIREQERIVELEKTIQDLHAEVLEHKQAEEALRKSEEKYRNIIEAVNEGIWVIDSEARITYVNQKMAEMLEYTPDEIIGRYPWDFTDEESKSILKKNFERRRENIDKSYEFKFINKDGSPQWLLINAKSFFDKDGKFAGSMGTLTDITEHKQAEEKLRYHANLIDNISDAIISTDKEMKIKSWNKAAERMYGWKADEVIGMKGSDILQTVFPEEFSREAIARDIFERGGWEGELIQRTKDGREINVYGKSVTLKDEAGAVIGGVSISSDVTKRKKAEEALRLLNLYNRSLIEVSLDPFVTIGPDGKITDVNNSTEIVTGYSRDELIGTDFSDYFTEPQKAKEGYQHVFLKGIVRDYPLKIRHRDGHVTSVLYNASVYKSESGEIIGVFAAARDITERQKAEEKLQKLANAVESSDDAFITKSLDGIITSWNKGAEKVYGYLTEEVLGKNISILEPDNIKGETKHLIEKAKQGERVQHYETLRLKKDGTIINVSVTLSPVFDSSGKLIAISTIARDITDNKKAEEAVRLSNIYNRSLIEASLDPLVTIGHDGKITDVNIATELVTGYSRSELIGTDFSDYFTEPEKAREGYQQVFTNGEVRDYPLEIQHKDGKITPVLYNASVYKDENNEIIGVFAAARDISDLKKAEKALKKAYSSLEEKIKERTAELENAYKLLKESEIGLAEAQKMAHIGNWDWDLINGRRYWSDEVYRIYGCDSQKPGESYDELFNYIHPDDREYVEKSIQNVLKGENKSGINYRIVLANGEERTIYSQAEVIFDEQKIPVRVKGIVQDITERKKAEDKLKESEEKYRNIVETANEGILIINDKAIITYANQKITDMLGYTLEEGIGRPIWDFISEEWKAIVKLSLERRQKGINHSYELKLMSKDGLPLWVIVNAKALFDKNGKFIGSLSMLTDITERKEAEEALAKIEDIRIKEIHHRIKNNLQVISSLLSLEAEKFSDRKILDAFQESQNRVASMALIHEELYKGKDIDTLDFAAYLRKLTADLLKSYHVGSDKISLKLDLEQAHFDMDIAIPLGIIVNELFSNSLKHAFPDGRKGEIRIALKRGENFTIYEDECRKKGNFQYVLKVEDNGIGFSEKLDTQTAESLGLQLVHVLIDQLDGFIELKRSKGTEFTILFSVVK